MTEKTALVDFEFVFMDDIFSELKSCQEPDQFALESDQFVPESEQLNSPDSLHNSNTYQSSRPITIPYKKLDRRDIERLTLEKINALEDTFTTTTSELTNLKLAIDSCTENINEIKNELSTSIKNLNLHTSCQTLAINKIQESFETPPENRTHTDGLEVLMKKLANVQDLILHKIECLPGMNEYRKLESRTGQLEQDNELIKRELYSYQVKSKLELNQRLRKHEAVTFQPEHTSWFTANRIGIPTRFSSNLRNVLDSQN